MAVKTTTAAVQSVNVTNTVQMDTLNSTVIQAVQTANHSSEHKSIIISAVAYIYKCNIVNI